MVDKELAVELYKSHIKIRTTGEIIRPILIRLNIIVLPFIIAIASIAVILLTRVIEIPLGDFKEVVRDFEGGSFGRRFSGDVPDKLSTGFNNMADEYEGTFITLKI
jgi:methyl-accepting chemotaxis protein